MNRHVYDMLIIGGGPGGYTAALYAARAGLDVVLLEKLSAGGQMAQTHQIDNYPGFVDGIDGFDLAERMQLQAERFGAETEYVFPSYRISSPTSGVMSRSAARIMKSRCSVLTVTPNWFSALKRVRPSFAGMSAAIAPPFR